MKSWWLCLGFLLACADDAPERDGIDASLDAALPSLDAMPSGPDASDADLCNAREQRLPVMSAFHVPGELSYADPPPVGGDHNQCWAKWGAHDEEVPDERWVHNLEHGGVVFLYNCPNGCANEVDTMRVFVSGRTQALLTPYAALRTRFAVVAWGVRLTTDCFDMPAFERFYQQRVGSKDAPEPMIANDPPRSCN